MLHVYNSLSFTIKFQLTDNIQCFLSYPECVLQGFSRWLCLVQSVYSYEQDHLRLYEDVM